MYLWPSLSSAYFDTMGAREVEDDAHQSDPKGGFNTSLLKVETPNCVGLAGLTSSVGKCISVPANVYIYII